MSLTDLLECFDTAPARTGPDESWLAGHAAGLAEGRAQAEADEGRLHSETARALADLVLTFEEARSDILARLAPFFAVLAETAVPRLLRDTLGAALIDELLRAATADTEAPLILHVAPDDVTAIKAALLLAPGLQVTLRADAKLSPGQILIEGEGAAGATSLDLARLERDISAALAALAEPVKGHEHHG